MCIRDRVKVIAAVATAAVAVVNPDIEVDVPSEELSMGCLLYTSRCV